MVQTTKTAVRQAIAALDRMEKATGRLSKEVVLEQEHENEILREMLRMALGGDMYHIRLTANLISMPTITDERDAWQTFTALAAQLTARELTGHKASMTADRFMAALPPEISKWFRRILNHDLRIGVSQSTITKAWGRDFWRTSEEKDRGWSFNGCLLAKKYEDVYKKKKPRFPLATEPKLDGERALVFVFPGEDRIHIVTRSNKRRQHIEEVTSFVEQMCSIARMINRQTESKLTKPVFLDGEFLAKGGSWNRTSSLIRSTKNFDRDAFLDEIQCVLFDWAWIDTYMKGKFEMPWKRRKKVLLSCTKKSSKRVLRFSDNVWILNHQIVLDADELQEVYNRNVDLGFEGIMVKTTDGPHVFKRTDLCVKLKPEDDVTGKIIDVVGGKGKHAAVQPATIKKVRAVMQEWGPVKNDGHYLHCKTDHPKALAADIKQVISDATDRRLSQHINGCCSFRYGERLGYLVVEYKKRQFHVGGGFTHAAGNDQRMRFWRHREDLKGMNIDFRMQRDKTEVAIGRFNRFVRLREDLS